MKKSLEFKILAIGFCIGFVLVIVPFLVNGIVALIYSSKIYTDKIKIPGSYAALVLGAQIEADGRPKLILTDRVKAAVDLYKAGKVKKLIMSGDNRTANYNEPKAMIELAIELGVPEQDLQADYAGLRTYDSCARVKDIFGQTKIIVVTQSFHIIRSVFLCQSLGIETYGFVSDSTEFPYFTWLSWQVRDIYSLVKNVADIFVIHPSATGGEKIRL